MTLRELVLQILSLPSAELDKPAGVWPPGSCPAASFVSVTGIGKTVSGAPVLLTGKDPNQPTV